MVQVATELKFFATVWSQEKKEVQKKATGSITAESKLHGF